MENNVEHVRHSDELREGTRALVDRAVSLSRVLLDACPAQPSVARGGRKAHRLES